MVIETIRGKLQRVDMPSFARLGSSFDRGATQNLTPARFAGNEPEPRFRATSGPEFLPGLALLPVRDTETIPLAVNGLDIVLAAGRQGEFLA